MLALVGVVTSPVVAQTRLFCRYTGVEIANCSEQEVPVVPSVKGAGCCEHRVFLPLADSKLAAGAEDAVAPPALLALPAPTVLPALSLVRSKVEEPVAGAGPPLFVQHRALLI